MDSRTEELVSTIGFLYEITHEVSPTVWRDAYERIAKLFRADGTGALTIFDQSKEQMISMEGRVETVLLSHYLHDLQFSSPLRQKLAKLKVGERLNRAEVISDEDLRANPIYESIYKRANMFHVEYRVLMSDGPLHAGIFLTRSEGKPNFSKNEISAMDRLMPHLSRAFKLRFQIAHTNKYAAMLSTLIDRSPRGALVVDQKKEIKYSNTSAVATLNLKDGLSISSGNAFVADDTAAEAKLKRAVDKVLDGSSAGDVHVSIERTSGKRPYELTLMPLMVASGPPLGDETLVSIFISDMSYEPNSDGDILIGMYDLTPAESKVAMQLAGGRSLNQIADELKTSKHTARTHLKRVLSKTNTHSQGELIRLLLTGPAALRPVHKKE